jgi:hypothetical protein
MSAATQQCVAREATVSVRHEACTGLGLSASIQRLTTGVQDGLA